MCSNTGTDRVFDIPFIPLRFSSTRMSIIYRGKIVDTGTLEELRERSGTSKLEDIFLNVTGEGDLGPVIKSLRETMSS